MSGDFKSAAEYALERALAWRKEEPKVPIIPKATRDELRTLFDIGLPDQGREGIEVIKSLAKAAESGLVANTHPNFFAWVMGSSHTVGVAADILTSAWGQNAGIYQTAPAAAIAEEVVAKWLLDLLQLPKESSVGFATGATMASFICLAAARSEVLKRIGYDLEEEGLAGAPEIHVFLGEEAHATIYADLRYLGFGRKNLVEIKTDQQGRMLVSDLDSKMAQYSGPVIIVAQAGHINSGAFDPFIDIIQLAKTYNAWVHVDGAFGLWARSVNKLAHLCEGLDQADSWTVDGHKWLQVPYDSGFAIIKHEDAHRRAMDISASYLTHKSDDGRSPSAFTPELSRRARGFAVWAVMQSLGRQGIAEIILRHCNCARYLEEKLKGITGINIMNDVVLNQLAVTFGETSSVELRNRMTNKVIEKIHHENKNFVLGANWREQEILRISIISEQTDIQHMDNLSASIINAWSEVQAEC